MASRVLRVGIRTSEPINQLHDKTYRLWTHLLTGFDDFGLIELTYGTVKECAPLQPWDRETVAKMLGELVDAGLILPYEFNGARYAACAKHQSVINTVKPRCPVPTWGLTHCLRPKGYKDKACREAAERLLPHLDWTQNTSGTPEVPEVPPSGTRSGTTEGTTSGTSGVPAVEEGVWGKGVGVRDKDGATANSAPAAKGSRLTGNWTLPDGWAAWAIEEAREKGKTVPMSTVIDWGLQFRDYWQAVPGAKGVKADWLATWRNAVRDLYLPKVPATSTQDPFSQGI